MTTPYSNTATRIDKHPAWEIPLEQINVSEERLFSNDTVGPYFARLRRDAPVHYCANSRFGPFWSITRYKDVQAVELNHEVFSSEASLGGTSLSSGGRPMRPLFMMMDPPKHDEQRNTVNGIAKPANIDKLKTAIRENVRDILDHLPDGEPFDWVERVSVEQTTRMLAIIFDFPFAERSKLTRWSDLYSGTPEDEGPVTSWDMRRAELAKAREVFDTLLQARAKQAPGVNLLSMMAHAPETKAMSPSELLGNIMLLVVGGNDTTRNSISGGLLALIEHPEQFAKLREAPELIAPLVPEIIRWQTPISHMARTALFDYELHGQEIKQGDRVALWYLSANRDESFIENPDSFIIDRKNPRRHLSFGFGIHHCMGSRLAETQLQILWEEILARDMHFELAGEPVRNFSNIMHGFSRMPIRITSRSG